MGHINPQRAAGSAVLFAVAVFGLATQATAQTGIAATTAGPWRRIGNTALLRGLPSAASGPVQRVWYSSDGNILFARTGSGVIWQTSDLEIWRPAPPTAVPPAPQTAQALRAPSDSAQFRKARASSPQVYAFGSDVWRSEDEGVTWRNLTRWQGGSLLGAPVADVAVHPLGDGRVAVASETGVWFSVDGGLSWRGLNDALPNLPVRRIAALPKGASGLRIMLENSQGAVEEFEWMPGQKSGWIPVPPSSASLEVRLRQTLAAFLQTEITAMALAGDAYYVATADGRILSTMDAGRTWRGSAPNPATGAVQRIWTSAGNPRAALILASAAAGSGTPRVLRTTDAGGSWDDLSANLPVGEALAITADPATGATYVATSSGLYYQFLNLQAPAPGNTWLPAQSGLPSRRTRDLTLDEDGLFLYAAVEGYGVFTVRAPHLNARPRLAHTADYRLRPAAPGALLSVMGATITSASTGQLDVPVLNAQDSESQIQVPFEVEGNRLDLTLAAGATSLRLGLPLEPAAPAILVDRDGSPMLLDAETGSQVEALQPARPGETLQILASGLGRVTPDWPTGLPAPLENAPRVAATVRAFLNGSPVPVSQAALAPGYIGYYLVEIELPALLDAGNAELTLEIAGRRSNAVRLHISR